MPLLYGKVFKGGRALVSMERKKPVSDLEQFLDGFRGALLTVSLVSACVVAPYVVQEIVKPVAQDVKECLVDYHNTYSKITIPMN